MPTIKLCPSLDRITFQWFNFVVPYQCRYSFARIIAWLQCKTEQTLQALKETCPRVLSQEPGSDMLYATTLLTECLSVEWEKYLIQSLGLVSSSLRPPKRDALENQSRLPEKVAKVCTCGNLQQGRIVYTRMALMQRWMMIFRVRTG